jgi:hypothetical protein
MKKQVNQRSSIFSGSPEGEQPMGSGQRGSDE